MQRCKKCISYKNVYKFNETCDWNIIYKFNCKLIKYKIIEDTYNECTKKYLKELNNTTTIMYTYTTFVSNKLGIDSFNQQIKKNIKQQKISIILF